MTQSKTQTPSLLFGNDTESIEANRKYQEALQRLTESLDTRKNRLFDPYWMAAARGFLDPGSANTFESLGRVAKNLGEVQVAQEKENRDIAQMQLDVAGRGLEMQRQKSLHALAARQRQQAGEPSGAPQGGQRGFQIAPPDPNRITGNQYYDLAIARGVSPDEAMKVASQIDEKNRQVREGGVFDARSGMFYPNKYETVDYQIFGQTYKIPQGAALELDYLAGSGDEAKFTAAARKAIRDFQRPAAQVQAAQGPVAQGAAAQTPPPLAQTSSAPSALSQAAPSALPQAAPALPASAPPVVVPPRAAEPQPAEPAQAAPAGGPAIVNADDVKRRIQELARQHLAEPGARPDQVPPATAQQAPQAAASAARPPAALPAAPQVAQAAPAAVQPAAPAAVTPAAPPVVAQAARPDDTRMRSQQQMEIEQAQAKARAEAEVKKEIESREEISANAKRARDITATANVLRRMADAPDFDKMTGILSNDKWTSAMALLAREGIGGRNISIGIPGIEDAMRNARLNPDQQARFRTYLMYTAQMNLAAEQTMKGQTTERERQILGNATISTQDTKETVRIKADLLNLKAQFDKRVENAFEDAKMTPREFYRSETYDTMYKTYIERLERVATGMMMLPSRGGAQPGAQRQGAQNAPAQGRANGSISAAGDLLRELIKPPQQRRP